MWRPDMAQRSAGTNQTREAATRKPATRARQTTVQTMALAAVRPKLLRWYDRNRRDLPWRRTMDPYRIWVSEIMLQQTRVQAVIPYYERFLAKFPDVRKLAAAS